MLNNMVCRDRITCLSSYIDLMVLPVERQSRDEPLSQTFNSGTIESNLSPFNMLKVHISRQILGSWMTCPPDMHYLLGI